MSDFPGKWFDFTNQKELKRLRADVNNTLSLKIQVASSIIIAIVGFFLDDYIQCGEWWLKLIICIGMCVIVAGIFLFPSIQKWYKLRKSCNIIIKGKDAVNVFDDEIVYDVLVAYEYYLALSKTESNGLKDDINQFYNLEIKYYLTDAINKLCMFSANYNSVFGEGNNRISKERVQNVTSILEKLITCTKIGIDTGEGSDYDTFKKMLNKV